MTRGQDNLLNKERYHISLLNSFRSLCEKTMGLLPMLLLPASSQDQDNPGLEQATQFTMEIRCSLSDLPVADFELYRKQHGIFPRFAVGVITVQNMTFYNILVVWSVDAQEQPWNRTKRHVILDPLYSSCWDAQKQYSPIRNHASNYCTVA